MLMSNLIDYIEMKKQTLHIHYWSHLCNNI